MIRLIHVDGYMVVSGDEVKIHCNGGDLLYMLIGGLQSMHDECGV